jgi:ABC-type multidrug transport system fused ATPase/permease subunit
MMLQAAATIAVGLIIAFIYSWKFALFVFGNMPFLLLAAVMQIRIAKGFSMKNKAELEGAGKVSITNCAIYHVVRETVD